MKLYLTRHGETTLNRERKFYGSLDVSIDDTGIQQARSVAQQLADKQFTTVYISGLKRALETATIILSQHTPVPVIRRPGLNEMDFGAWEGLNANEIQAQFPVRWQEWLDSPFKVVPTQAEGFIAFQQRVIETVKPIINDHSQKAVLIVAHRGTLRIINQLFFPEVDYWTPQFNAGTYTLIDTEQLKA